MMIHEWLNKHPDEHVRIICYTPAPDVLDEYGKLVCGGEGTSEIVFDSTTGAGDLAPDLLLKEIINSPDGELSDEELADPDHVWELEYIPDAYWTLD